MLKISPKRIYQVVGQSIARPFVERQVGGELNDALHEISLVVDEIATETSHSDIFQGVEVFEVETFECRKDMTFVRFLFGARGDDIGRLWGSPVDLFQLWVCHGS